MANNQRRDTADSENGEDPLKALVRDLDRCRTRARRQRRKVTGEAGLRFDNATSASEWSQSIDQAAAIAELISREPARDLGGLAIKFDAIWWWIAEDDSVLDETARVWLARIRRALHRLAREP